MQQQADDAASLHTFPAWMSPAQQAAAQLSAGQLGTPALPGQESWLSGNAAAADVAWGQGSSPALHGHPGGGLAEAAAAEQGQGHIPALHGSGTQATAGGDASPHAFLAWTLPAQQAAASLSAGQSCAPALPGQELWLSGSAAAASVAGGQSLIPALHGSGTEATAGGDASPHAFSAWTLPAQQAAAPLSAGQGGIPALPGQQSWLSGNAADAAWGQGLIPALRGTGTEATASSIFTAQPAGTSGTPAQGVEGPFGFGARAAGPPARSRWNKKGPRLRGRGCGWQQPGASSQFLSAAPKGDGGGAAPAAIGVWVPQAQNGGSAADPATLNTDIEIQQVSP